MLVVLSLPGAKERGYGPAPALPLRFLQTLGAVWFGLRGIDMLVYLSIFSIWHQMRLECSQAEPVVRGKQTSGHTELHRKAQIGAL